MLVLMGSNQSLPVDNPGHSIVRTIELSPLETAILHLLYFERRDMDNAEIWDAIEPLFGEIKTADLMQALVNILEKDKRYVQTHNVITDDDKNLVVRYSVSTTAFETYFSWATRGRRAGSDQHIETMKLIADQQMRRGHYCRPDLGDEGQSLPDMVIVEPETVEYKGKPVFSQNRWNEKTALAVEVEKDPTRHREQIYTNWKKNYDSLCNVLFVVFSEKHVDAVTEIMASHDVPPTEYSTVVFSKEMLTPGHAINVELPYISSHRNITNHGIPQKPQKDAPLLTAMEFKIWKVFRDDNGLTDKQMRDALTAEPAVDWASIGAFLGLLHKKTIRISGGKIVGTVDESLLYEKMVRAGKRTKCPTCHR